MRKLNPKHCKKYGHLWKVRSYSAKSIDESCARCAEQRGRAPTPAERKQLRKAFSRRVAMRTPGVHKLSHAYDRATSKLSGYPRMLADRKWAEKHPKSILISHVDDAHFCNSQLTFVMHEDKKPPRDSMFDPFRAKTKKPEPEWMGVSVHYVPQCTGEKPISFFLYPSDIDGLVDTLKRIQKHQRTYPEVRRDLRRWAAERRKRRR